MSSARHAPRPQPASRASQKVLLVEDDAAVRHVSESILTQLGYQVVACASGEEAIAIVAKDKRSFDLLVTDVILLNACRADESANRRSAIANRRLDRCLELVQVEGLGEKGEEAMASRIELDRVFGIARHGDSADSRIDLMHCTQGREAAHPVRHG